MEFELHIFADGSGLLGTLKALTSLQDPFAASRLLDDLESDLDGGNFTRPGFTG